MPERVRLGVCAMDRKARSKPMRNILSRLLATGRFDITVFGDKVILDEAIENWPVCDVLISFFSDGFPMDKAIDYVNLRDPVCVNDLSIQKVFWDRRVVLQILDTIGVPTSRRLECNRDGGPHIAPDVVEKVRSILGIRVDTPRPMSQVHMADVDTIVIDGQEMRKPYVEKPVSGEDHNIIIYFPSSAGGGARRLFRKIGNQSSAFDADRVAPRTEGSYVYEEFVDVENKEDIKVYTLGPDFVHAETRKSPVVDGLVRRNNEGKEIRFVCALSPAEEKMAHDIAQTFRQNICGFDLLRAGGKSVVIDVNGWSFVKGNDAYYDKCAAILARFAGRQPTRALGTATPRAQSWHLKSSVFVLRHGDRTPKCKLKFSLRGRDAWSQPFIALLQGRTAEIILRDPHQLAFVADAADAAAALPGADLAALGQLRKIIDKKKGMSGTKVQLKPTFTDGACTRLAIVVKWGGEFTHAARYQARELAENIRKDYTILNGSMLVHANVYSSSERRVVATAETFSSALLDDHAAPAQTHELIIRKDLLDDSNAAKEEMDAVKKRLKVLCRPGLHARPEFAWPAAQDPFEVVQETIALMRAHRRAMYANWERLDVENVQARWCCGEYPYLFRERWEALFVDWCDKEPDKFDPSRVSELYDSLKYDALHNRVFLEAIFEGVEARPEDFPAVATTTATDETSAVPVVAGEKAGETTAVEVPATPTTESTTPESAVEPAAKAILAATSASAADAVSAATPAPVADAASTDSPSESPRTRNTSNESFRLSEPRTPTKLRELYANAKLLFDLIAPQEYGIERSEKESIGLLTSLPLLSQVVSNLETAKSDEEGSSNFYFTKESHIHTLVNLVTLSDLPIVMPQVPELDYMSYIAFEIYERQNGGIKEFSVRISLSMGAHSSVIDVSLDAKHALQVQPRHALTDYINLDSACEILSRHQATAQAKLLKKSTTKIEGLLPIEGDEIFKGAKSRVEEIRKFKSNRPDSIYGAMSEVGEPEKTP